MVVSIQLVSPASGETPTVPAGPTDPNVSIQLVSPASGEKDIMNGARCF